MPGKILFEVATPLGFTVRASETYWHVIVENKHPVMQSKVRLVQETLQRPNEVRRSRGDPSVYLFYRKQTANRWICAVTKKLNAIGFLITTYPTDAIKEGQIIWTK